MTSSTAPPTVPTVTTSSSPTTAPRPSRLPRGRRTVSAVIVATLLLIVAVVVAWQAILVQTGRELYGVNASAIADRLHLTPWNDTAVTIAAAALMVVGLWLLALAVLPSPRRYLQLREADPVLVTGINRRNLRRALDGAAQRVNGISAAETRLTKSTATTSVTSSLSMTGGLTETAQNAITTRLQQLDPVEPIAVRVQLSGQRRR